MVHSGGVNRSADARWVPEGPQIRMVVPCDFQKEGLTYLESETSNPGPNHQWWVNTRQVRAPAALVHNQVCGSILSHKCTVRSLRRIRCPRPRTCGRTGRSDRAAGEWTVAPSSL